MTLAVRFFLLAVKPPQLSMSNRNPSQRLRPEQRGRGGKREGSGRPPNWLREQCRKIIDREKLLNFYADAASWRLMDHRVVDGQVMEVPATLETRLLFSKELFDRGFGKSTQPMEHSGSIDLDAEAAQEKRKERVTKRLNEILDKRK